MQPKKTEDQIQAMRDGGKILARILHDLRDFTKPGVTDLEIDAWVRQQIKSYGAEATYLTPEVNFPAAIIVCIDEQVVHTPPSGRTLQKGDVVSFDLVITYRGMKTDSAFTMVVGEEPKGATKHLLATTERSLYAGIDAIRGTCHTGDIGEAVERMLTASKLSVIRELVGHGVGQEMHMAPEVPNYGRRGTGALLRPGDTVAIEPMAALGDARVIDSPDGWTYSTRDGSLSAHFEHTVLITENGAEILTQL